MDDNLRELAPYLLVHPNSDCPTRFWRLDKALDVWDRNQLFRLYEKRENGTYVQIR